MANLEIDATVLLGLARRLRSASARVTAEPALAGAERGLGADDVEAAVAASAVVYDAMIRQCASEIDGLAEAAVATARIVADADERLAAEVR